MTLADKKYLQLKTNENGEEIFVLKNPCEFKIRETEVNLLKSHYKSTEEIGGYISFRWNQKNEKTEFISEDIIFLTNSYDSSPYKKKGRSNKNTFWAKREDKSKALNEIFQNQCIPIFFHSHPTDGFNILEKLYLFIEQRETSKQDQKVSKNPITFKNGEKLLIPDSLIVGNPIERSKLFIGFYNGFIAPLEFEKERNDVMQKNLKKIIESISSPKLGIMEIIGIVTGTFLFLMLIWEYRKYSLPVIVSLIAMLSINLTDNNKDGNYYSQLNFGDAKIKIP